jgi:ATP-dependent DNA ligase
MVAEGLEGVMAKHLASPYCSGRRSAAWRKIKPRPRRTCREKRIQQNKNTILSCNGKQQDGPVWAKILGVRAGTEHRFTGVTTGERRKVFPVLG